VECPEQIRTTEEERPEEIGFGESGGYEGSKETKVDDEILSGVSQRESRCKRVLGASEKCGAASSGVEIGITERAGRMGYIEY
jgi:hypothetical protein